MGSALDHLDHQEEISQIFHGRFSCPQQSINCHESIINGRFHCVDRLGLLASLLAIRIKVIIEKSCGEGSLMKQDTIENVS